MTAGSELIVRLAKEAYGDDGPDGVNWTGATTGEVPGVFSGTLRLRPGYPRMERCASNGRLRRRHRMTDERFCSLPTGIRVCYTDEGDKGARPLVLIAGIGLDLWSWDPQLVTTMTDAGFRVIRLDNRDAGRSTQISNRPPGRYRRFLGRPAADDYALEDMADDVIGLLDHLHVTKVDVVGMSMGGMIGQILAARHPERVRTLVSIISTTGDRRVGQPTRSTRLALMSRPASDADSFARGYLLLQRHIASGPFGTDPAADERWALQAWTRMAQTPGFIPGAGFSR